MSKFAEAILKAFGMAAREAEDQEAADALIPTAAAALDAEPAAPAQDAEPAVPAADAGSGPVEAKLDRIITLLEARDAQPEEPGGEAALDALLGELEGSASDGGAAGGKENAPLTGPARDAAAAILRSVRPAVAAIADRAERTKVADALLEAVKGGGTLEAITKAVQHNARDAAAKPSFEQICEEQKAAYDARNPHKKQEV